MFITYFRPSWWLPGLEFIWGVFTGCIAACKTAEPIYGLRALIGLAESSAYPGTVTMLSAWLESTKVQLTPSGLVHPARDGQAHWVSGIGRAKD